MPNTIYFASNLGRIKSIDRECEYYSEKAGRKVKTFLKGFIRKQHLNKRSNYYEISIAHPDRKSRGKRTPQVIKAHRMVASAFHPNPLNLPEVNHKDGNRLNNKADNLEWCTSQENKNHAAETGLLKYSIPIALIDKVLKEHKNGATGAELQKKYNLTSGNTYRILLGQRKRYQQRRELLGLS